MFLTHANRQELYEAFLGAFNLTELENLVYFSLDKRLEELVSIRGSAFTEIVLSLITWAEEHGQLAELVKAAVKERPHNAKLQEFAANWNSSINASHYSGEATQKPSPTIQLNSESSRRLRVFLCHSSGDKQSVRNLYHRLRKEGVEPWLDEENLLPGQDWQHEIMKAVRASDMVVVCLSSASITKAGYVQKEIKYALDVAEEQPEDTIFIIPLRLEECVVPSRLSRWHWVDLFEDRGYGRLLQTLQRRANDLKIFPGELKAMPHPVREMKTKAPRVRGVLAAARKAIEQLPGSFDKNQLLAKLVEMDPEFAHKRISAANIRSALRLLTQDGVIKIESEATATSCARYVKAE